MTDAVTLLINKEGVDLNVQNWVCLFQWRLSLYGDTPLHVAIKNNMTDAVTLLINKEGVDLNVPNHVCLYLPWRRPHDFLLLSVCLSLSP
jgi:ankyrin repeat protein